MLLDYDAIDLRRDLLAVIDEWDPTDTTEFMTDLDGMFHNMLDGDVIGITNPLVTDIQFGEHGDDNQYLEIVVVLGNGLGLVDIAPLPTNDTVVGGNTGFAALLHALGFIDRAADQLLARLAAIASGSAG